MLVQDLLLVDLVELVLDFPALGFARLMKTLDPLFLGLQRALTRLA